MSLASVYVHAWIKRVVATELLRPESNTDRPSFVGRQSPRGELAFLASLVCIRLTAALLVEFLCADFTHDLTPFLLLL